MPLFDGQTPEVIRSRILSRMGTALQTREGSYTYDMVSPVAFEIWRVLMTLGELISAFYVDENSGKYLDMHAALLDLARREGTKAAAVIHFTGRDGVTVPAGTSFFTPSGLEFTLDADAVLADGTGAGTLTAVQVGDKYNVEAGEISQIMRNIVGLTGYSNDAAEGGTDPESDAALFERIAFRRKNPATSGNEAHYIEWALECDGVGACKVTRLWNGPGTVRVLLADYDRQPVDDAVVTAVTAHIEEKRPVCADVTVISVTGTPIDVSAALILDESVTLAEVREAFVSELDTYLQGQADAYFETSEASAYTLYYNKVAALLMGVDGVTDYSALTVNGGTANIVIDATAVPVPGEVTLT